MTAAKPNTPMKTDSPLPVWLDNTLLCIVLGLTMLRATVIESPHIDPLQSQFLGSEMTSLWMSTALLACGGLWLLAVILRGRFSWRKTGFGLAACLFIVAGIGSACFASDKRAAITSVVTLTSPMLAGLLLVQLLNSAVKIRLALLLVLAVGISATIQCFDQYADSNEAMVADYEADSDSHLRNLGIEPDSMEHWMYEHRLYSKDIRGFLLTSNSAASFFLLAGFAGLGLILQIMGKKMSQESIAAMVSYLLAFAGILYGLFLTQSKGGIGAFVLGVGLLVMLLMFGNVLWKRRLFVGIILVLLIVVSAGLLVQYGTQHDRLPGGNSMLVRWQYWASTAEMIGSHLLTGVGGGNFSTLYTHYKIPAASETVQDPHNWILSLLSQYGLLGLGAFIAAILLPLYRIWGRWESDAHPSVGGCEVRKNGFWIGLLATVWVILLVIRPAMVDTGFLFQPSDARSAAYLVLYLFPAGVFAMAFILLRVASLGDESITGHNSRLMIALVCGLVAVLIHNLIDFAIFEPGVFGIFWLFIAIIIAQAHAAAGPTVKSASLDASKRLGLLAGMALVGSVYLGVVLLPPMRAGRFFKQAMVDQVRRVERIEAGIAADAFSEKTAYKASLMFKQVYQQQPDKDIALLEKAAGFAHVAAARNAADFKPWRLLSQIELLQAEQADGERKEKYLQMAFDDLQQAISRYPGSGKLHYNLALVAEQRGQNDVALCHYRTAIKIEDAYRAQFRVMYPERDPVISRIGNGLYIEAKFAVERLAEPDTQ